MKRAEFLSKLEQLIPSFQREWSGYGGTNSKEDKYGFLYRDGLDSVQRFDGSYLWQKLPFSIPDGFLVGKQVENLDKTEQLISVPPRKEVDGKIRIGMDIVSFAGYSYAEHTYGTLSIPSPHWQIVGKSTIIAGSYRDYTQDPNFDPRIGQWWNVELCRIITEEDINSRADWDGWHVGDANQRFVSISEMFLTACWVALARVESPFILQGSPSWDRDDRKTLLSVDEDGNVTAYNFFFENVTPSQWKLFEK